MSYKLVGLPFARSCAQFIWFAYWVALAAGHRFLDDSATIFFNTLSEGKRGILVFLPVSVTDRRGHLQARKRYIFLICWDDYETCFLSVTRRILMKIILLFGYLPWNISKNRALSSTLWSKQESGPEHRAIRRNMTRMLAACLLVGHSPPKNLYVFYFVCAPGQSLLGHYYKSA